MTESTEQLDPTEELSVETVQKKTARGVAILTVRTLFIQVIAFASVALLTVFLEPSEYGVFFLVSAVINFLAYFSDIGLAASLIQKKDKLSNEELNTVFTAQQILVLGLIVAIWSASPLITRFYNLGTDATYLLWALAFSLLLSSLKTIPSVLMERSLEFNKWVLPQIAETIVFYASAVLFASSGFGVASFTVAVLLRGIVGLIATYTVKPWRPSIAFSLKAFKSILRFGVPYQANTFLSMIKDDGMILFLGGILGPSGVGLLGWAQKWAYAPLRFFMDQVIKVTFPAFARLQGSTKDLSNAVSKSIFYICLLVFPSIALLVLVAPALVEIIPRYGKWSAALTALSLICINSALAAVTTPMTNALNAIGKILVTFRLMVMWTILTWILVPALSTFYGVNGAAMGLALVGLSSIFAIFLISKYIVVDYLQNVGKPFLATLIAGLAAYFASGFFPHSILQVSVIAVIGFCFYTVSILVLEPKLIHLLINFLKRSS